MKKCRPCPAPRRNRGQPHEHQFDGRRGAAARSGSSLSWITKTTGIQHAAFDAADVIVVETSRPDAVRQASKRSDRSLSDFVFGRYRVQSGLPLKPESEHAAGVRS